MDKRLSRMAATAALTALPLLAACGATTTEPASTAPATQAVPSAGTTASSTPSSSSTPTPTFDKAKESDAVSDATEKFASELISLSYQDSSIDDYLKRIRPLTTDDGYAEVKKEVKEEDFDKILKTLKPVRGRSVSSVKGDVKVDSVTADAAETSFKFQVKFQQKTGSGWKTLKTSPAETGRIDFVNEDGEWLVDHLPAA